MSNLFVLAEKFAKKLADTQYIYHIKPPNLKGNVLYPLSELQDLDEKIYQQAIKKYKGRESHPETKIKCLDCQWKDCVNFSALNPAKLFALEMLLGVRQEKTAILKLPISSVSDLDFCLYDDKISPKKDEAYKKISVKNYKESKFIDPEIVSYFVKSEEKNELPLIFGYVTHVLVKGKVKLEKAEVIEFDPENFQEVLS